MRVLFHQALADETARTQTIKTDQLIMLFIWIFLLSLFCCIADQFYSFRYYYYYIFILTIMVFMIGSSKKYIWWIDIVDIFFSWLIWWFVIWSSPGIQSRLRHARQSMLWFSMFHVRLKLMCWVHQCFDSCNKIVFDPTSRMWMECPFSSFVIYP